MQPNHFDYIIIGNGLAGLQLALALAQDNFFKQKKIGLIDKSQKTENDKTWCFWEQEKGKWDSIVSKSWNKGLFYSLGEKIQLPLLPYSYKMIRSQDFYQYCKDLISQKNNFHFIIDEIINTKENGLVTIEGKKASYYASHVFDSRIPEAYHTNNHNYTRIFQHFKGWVIETEQPHFNPEKFTMMDFRVSYQNSTSFTYLLPLSETKALVEYTFFTSSLTEEATYEKQLQHYLRSILNIQNYTILETEQGIIPMTDFPFQQFNTKKITKIGTGGGWVKASTGYSFKSTEKKVGQLILHLKKGKNPSMATLQQKRFGFYDKIFLEVLHHNNSQGPWVFKQFYKKNTPQQVFSFLDEETTFLKEVSIMLPLFSKAFIVSFFRSIL